MTTITPSIIKHVVVVIDAIIATILVLISLNERVVDEKGVVAYGEVEFLVVSIVTYNCHSGENLKM